MKEIVVIGGGLAGALLCNALSNSYQVTLLEKGPENSIRHPDFVFDKKRLAGVSTCCYGGGGTTNLWHNGLIPLRPEDFESSDFRAVLEDSTRFTDQAAKVLFYTGSSYTKEHDQLCNKTLSLSSSFSSFPHGIDCLVYPKKYKRLIVSDAVEAVYDVEDISFKTHHCKVNQVEYFVGEQRHSVEADVVIVCAGTLGTPVLLKSLIESINGRTDNVGTGFIDHPMGFVGKVKIKKNTVEAVKKLSAWDQGDCVSRGAVRLKSPCGRYTACAFLRPALTMDNRLEIYKYKSALGAGSGMSRVKTMFSWKLFHPDIIAEIFAHLTGTFLPSRIFNILLIADQKRGTNRVYEKDGQIHVDWNVTDEEIRVYREMLVDLKNFFFDMSDEININTDITGDWLWSAAHHSGATSLGAGAEALVDTNLKLKCCDNVYVCDGSVLQEHSYANTGLAIGQLAFRLADHLMNHGPTQTTSDVKNTRID